MDEGGVVGIVGLGDNDLRIGVQNAQAGQQQRLAAAGGNENITGVQVNIQPLIVPPDCLDQPRVSGGSVIGQGPAVKLPHGLKIGGRRSKIRLTDVEVVDFLSPFFSGHRQRVEFSHRGRFASIGIDGYLHKYLHWRFCRHVYILLSDA